MSTTLEFGKFDQIITVGESDLFIKRRLLGGGSEADVFLVQLLTDDHGFGPNLGEMVIKKFKSKSDPGNSGQANLEQEFLEALHMNNIRHPNITLSYCGFTFNSYYHIISERGSQTLGEIMAKEVNKANFEDHVAWLLRESKGLAEAVALIHEPGDDYVGFHHDINPNNILLFSDQHNRLKLADWGCATMGKGKDRSSTAMGESIYNPPESAPRPGDNQENQATNEAHDIWSLGCIFFEMLIWSYRGLDMDIGPRKLKEIRNQLKAESTGDAKKAKYWVEKDGKRECAKIVLEQLKEQKDKGHILLRPLAIVTEKMLKVEESERLKAREVVAGLA
ncbi:hypothetical protein J1614_004026 [Plenodomus biglobosus]|nr:hypothetical protein J1614_004026 [Plenodomus biglobosus]